MDWRLAIKEERAALMRMVALLLVLANLAERAGGRSRAIRGFVLWILRPAESAARNFVTGSPDAPIAPTPVGPSGDSRADAMRLALSLRDLACELECQAKFVFAVPGDAKRAEPSLPGALQALNDDFRGILRQIAFVAFAHHAACATGPPRAMQRQHTP